MVGADITNLCFLELGDLKMVCQLFIVTPDCLTILGEIGILLNYRLQMTRRRGLEPQGGMGARSPSKF